MSWFSRFKTDWLRPSLFFGNNRLSLLGGALTTAAALIMVGFWIVSFFGQGGSSNPYLGIILDLILPLLLVFGLLLIPIGIWWRRRHLKAIGQLPTIFPKVDFGDPAFRHAVDFVVIATFINFVIVGTATYRGVAYMDTRSFCGQSCHVMAPEWTAYHVSGHQGVACTDCHVAPGLEGYAAAKMNGTRQLFEVVLHDYPRPIMAAGKVPAARYTCLNCHDAAAFIGDKLVVKSSFGNDDKNSRTYTMVLVHVGGRDRFMHLSGIHGAHLGHVEYIATDSPAQTIPWVKRVNSDGSSKEFIASGVKIPADAERHTMDCIDCHNRPAHSFDSAEDALDKDMADGTPSATLPFVHNQGMALIEAQYTSQQEATARITQGLENFYRTQYPAVWSAQRAQVDQAVKALSTIYSQNVFPFMKVTWGTHPNNLGHTEVLTGGCFRCHDGSHNAKDGGSITNDCSVCHNLLAVDVAKPKVLSALGIQ
jgi:nitrate/TMAO reductase-like tetraheme cytochrome c subunit